MLLLEESTYCCVTKKSCSHHASNPESRAKYHAMFHIIKDSLKGKGILPKSLPALTKKSLDTYFLFFEIINRISFCAEKECLEISALNAHVSHGSKELLAAETKRSLVCIVEYLNNKLSNVEISKKMSFPLKSVATTLSLKYHFDRILITSGTVWIFNTRVSCSSSVCYFFLL